VTTTTPPPTTTTTPDPTAGVTIQEQPDSRSGQASRSFASRQSRHYWIRGTADLAIAATALSNATSVYPLTLTCPINGITLYRSDVRYRPLRGKSGGCDLWDFVCDYEDPQALDDKRQLDTGSYRFRVSTSGGNMRITSSLAQVKAYTSQGSANPGNYFSVLAPDYQGALGVSRDGDVEGVDIVVPALRFTITYRQPLATITDAYVRTVEALTGTVNASTFYGRAAGEVLFLGADGEQGVDSDPTWSYDFSRMPNLTAQQIGDITGIAKKGHEYLWVLFEETTDAGAKAIVRRPKAVYIERLYQLAAFSSLGIGG
jgi:hypothetical protein